MTKISPLSTLRMRLGCAIWGHRVDNEVFRAASGSARRCRCGVEYLQENRAPTHVRHTLSCFLRHHTYVPLIERDRVHEYVCVRCGHPLVFPSDADRFASRARFAKKVRYACGLFGHRVSAVATRDGFIEYACHCGHSFLKRTGGAQRIRHPLICFFTAHRIIFLGRRAGYAEYVCEDCGHPFCFAYAASGRSTEGAVQGPFGLRRWLVGSRRLGPQPAPPAAPASATRQP